MSGEKGFTIIEAVIAASFLFVAGLIVCQAFAVSARLCLLNEMQRNAEAQAGEVTSWLAAQPRDHLIEGEGSLLIVKRAIGRDDALLDGGICLTARGQYLCDRVIVPDPAWAGAPPARPEDCREWPCAWRAASLTTPHPAGTRVLFARGWRINTRDADRNLLNVTVGVFADDEDLGRNRPRTLLSLRTTNIVPQ